MKIHELKIEHNYLVEVAAGRKMFELRKNDRDYQKGDLIRFIDIDETKYGVSVNIKKDDLYKITYVLKDVPQYGLDADYCILGIKRVKLREV